MAGDLHTNHPIEDGLVFILGHFKTPIWPRRISTKTTENSTLPVYSRDEALARFKQDNLLDCKISAYHYYVEWNGLNRQVPNLVFIDLDLARFKSSSKLDLDRALDRTLHTISDRPGGYSTVIWSGHGYHIYLPVEAFILEEESEFAKFEQPSRRFVQFAGQYLSNKNSDPCHAMHLPCPSRTVCSGFQVVIIQNRNQ